MRMRSSLSERLGLERGNRGRRGHRRPERVQEEQELEEEETVKSLVLGIHWSGKLWRGWYSSLPLRGGDEQCDLLHWPVTGIEVMRIESQQRRLLEQRGSERARGREVLLTQLNINRCAFVTSCAACSWSRIDGSSGGGPSMAHRRDSYLERMKDSTLLLEKSDGDQHGASGKTAVIGTY